jgi:hypothetical protein
MPERMVERVSGHSTRVGPAQDKGSIRRDRQYLQEYFLTRVKVTLQDTFAPSARREKYWHLYFSGRLYDFFDGFQ